MGIGTSLGAYFEHPVNLYGGIDNSVMDPEIDPDRQTNDNNEVKPKDIKQPSGVTEVAGPAEVLPLLRHKLDQEPNTNAFGNPLSDGRNMLQRLLGVKGPRDETVGERLYNDWLRSRESPNLVRPINFIDTLRDSGVPDPEIQRIQRQPSNIENEHDIHGAIRRIGHLLDQVPLPLNEDGSINEEQYHQQVGSHPMDPIDAANHFHDLYNTGRTREAISHALDYEDRASPEQWEVYEEHVNNPANYRNSAAFDHQHQGEHVGTQHDYDIDDIEDEEAASAMKAVPKWSEVANKKGVSLREEEPDNQSRYHNFGFMNEAGDIGTISLREHLNGKHLRVNGMYTATPDVYKEGPETFGTKDIMAVMSMLKERFPNAESISGYRISGARHGPARGRGSRQSNGEAFMQLRPPSDPDVAPKDFYDVQSMEEALRQVPGGRIQRNVAGDMLRDSLSRNASTDNP